ncbi:MAG: PVC-type heme-binding CxxCH protein [Fimbriiglobus sp.]
MRFALLVGVSAFLVMGVLLGTDPAASLPDGKKAATQQIAQFRTPVPLQIDLFAAEPMLASPVAIGLDEKNRVFVAEEYRFNQGTEENRTRAFFLEDDLQIRTLDDRLKMYEKHKGQFAGGMEWFKKHSEQVRLLVDTQGTGKADRSTVFATGFNHPLDGLAAGVMATGGKVYFTCIPNLWELTDEKDGVAQKRKAMHTGFGVNCAFLGHDLHGLIVGPDGKLYFSIGDRGFHVTTQEGKLLEGPRTGAVFRCNMDGSELEVVHRGLRNPQELAFDEHGNLFADDNNCDKGDHARLVYIVEGGDSGWNMAYQTIPDPYLTGPWHSERMWHLAHAGQPAWIVPTVGAIGTGPSGFLFTSGTSLPDRYKNSFMMCNYAGNGGLEAFKVKEQGAGFEIIDYHDFFKPIRATDAEFGTDGKLYIADFVDLKWTGGSAGGRIYTAYDKAKIQSKTVLETKAVFAEGFDKQTTERLAELLNHTDQRVRQQAQFALVKRPYEAIPIFLKALKTPGESLGALHAIWGLGMMSGQIPAAAEILKQQLNHPWAEARAQAAKTLPVKVSAEAELLKLLSTDANSRVKFFSAEALGKRQVKAATPVLFEKLAENADKDVYLRHAYVTALAKIGERDAVSARISDPQASVRLGVVLVLRQWKDERLAELLGDSSPEVRTEAARAVHDLPIESLYPKLAAQLTSRTVASDPFLRRAMHAAYRLGGAEQANAIVEIASSPECSELIRGEALAMLRDWAKPTPRDRVTGFWRPLAVRSGTDAKNALQTHVTKLLGSLQGKLQVSAVETLAVVGVVVAEEEAMGWAKDTQRTPGLRAAALKLLAQRKSTKFASLSEELLKQGPPLLSAAVRDLLAENNPTRAGKLVEEVLQNPQAALVERQRAFTTAAKLRTPEMGKLLDDWATKLEAGQVERELQIDVNEAIQAFPAAKRDQLRTAYDAKRPKDPIGKFAISLTGGDSAAGREIFFNHTAAQCIRCHKIDGQGGIAGPDLSQIASRKPEKLRDYLLESIVQPSAVIAEGFADITLNLADGRTVAGTLMKDDGKQVILKRPDGKTETIASEDIDSRTKPVSAMPTAERALTPREMRDLIEYLTTRK